MTVGDVVTLRATFVNPDGALFNPTAVTFKVTTPAGVTSTLGTPSNPSTGVYTIAYTVPALGEYEWWAVGTGSNAVADRGSFRVTQVVPTDTP